MRVLSQYLLSKISYIISNLTFPKVEQPTSEGKEVFHKKPLGRRRHLANRPLWSVRLVPRSLTRSESAASLEYFLAAVSLFDFRNHLYLFYHANLASILPKPCINLAFLINRKNPAISGKVDILDNRKFARYTFYCIAKGKIRVNVVPFVDSLSTIIFPFIFSVS